MNSVIILGNGGQGIRFMGNIFSKLLIIRGYEVSATYDYDAAMRGSDITGFIVFSKEKISNPIVDKADLLLILAKSKLSYNAVETVDFSSREKEKLINMHALGFLIKKFGLNVSKEELNEVLPSRGKEDNLKAVMDGMK